MMLGHIVWLQHSESASSRLFPWHFPQRYKMRLTMVTVLITVYALMTRTMGASSPNVQWASSPSGPKDPVQLLGRGLLDSRIVACPDFGLLNASCVDVTVLENRTDHAATVLVPGSLHWQNTPLYFYAVAPSCSLSSIDKISGTSAENTSYRMSAGSSAVVGCSVAADDVELVGKRADRLAARFDPPRTRPSWTNAPDPWFALGDRGVNGFTAGPNGWIRVVGRSLAFESSGANDGGAVTCIPAHSPETGVAHPAAQVQLWWDSGMIANLNATSSTCFDLIVDLGAQWSPQLQAKFNEVLGRETYMSVSNRIFGMDLVEATGPLVSDANGTQLIPLAPRPASQHRPQIDVLEQFKGDVQSALQFAQKYSAIGGADVILAADHSFEMPDGSNATVPANVTLLGTGGASSSSALAWRSNSSPGPSGAALLHLSGTSSRAENFTLLADSPAGIAALVTGNETSIRGLTVKVNAPAAAAGGDSYIANLLRIQSTGGFRIADSVLSREGECAGVGWSNQVALFLQNARGVTIENVSVTTTCQGYCGENTFKVITDGLAMHTVGNTTGGQGFNSLGGSTPLRMQHLAMLRGTDEGNLEATVERQETFTSDGGGGLYSGRIADYDPGTFRVTIANKSAANPGAYPNGVNGIAFIVMNGTAAGSWGTGRWFDSASGVMQLYTYMLALMGDAADHYKDVFVSIVPYKGRVVLAGNRYSDGTTLQIFGTGNNVIMADNTLTRMLQSEHIHPGGINVWGRTYQGGQQPLHRFQVYRNTMANATGVQVITSGAQGAPDGIPYNLGVSVVGNAMSLATNLTVQGLNEGVSIGGNSLCPLHPESCEEIIEWSPGINRVGA